MSRRVLLACAFLFTSAALTIVVTGGLVTTVLTRRLSVRSPLLSSVLAAVCVSAWFVLAYRQRAVHVDLEHVDRWLQARWRWLVIVIAASAAAVAAMFHAFSATGADASGYLSYASLLLDGQLTRAEPLALIAKWSGGPSTLAPLGWWAVENGMQAPTYAIGLPLLLAPLLAAGGITAASLLIPFTLMIAVATTALLAHRLGGATAAVLAAVWLASSPVALIESMQIMSDVPVTAAWVVCWWCVFTQRLSVAGGMAALAVLIRPNLAPLVLVPAVYLLRGRLPLARIAAFVVPVAGAGAIVAYVQWLYFGSPVRSGYGTASEIYVLGNVLPNAVLYTRWLFDTHGPWLFAAPLAVAIPSREVRWLLAFAALVVIGYLIYAVFESWTYLRFMLPAIAMAIVAVAVLISKLLARLHYSVRGVAVAVLVLAVAATNLAAARQHGVFRFADRQQRGRVVGERLAATLPVNTVIIGGEHSGTMRFYTGFSVLRWDLTAAGAMPEAIDWLTLNGYQLWVVLDDWEEEAFRRKFPQLAAASIDYEPAVQSAGGLGIRTRAWRARRFDQVPAVKESEAPSTP